MFEAHLYINCICIVAKGICAGGLVHTRAGCCTRCSVAHAQCAAVCHVRGHVAFMCKRGARVQCGTHLAVWECGIHVQGGTYTVLCGFVCTVLCSVALKWYSSALWCGTQVYCHMQRGTYVVVCGVALM